MFKKLEKIKEKARKDKDVLGIIVFGSYARKESKPFSDIDVCIVLQPKRFDNLFMTNKMLEYLGLVPEKYDIQIFQQLPLFIRTRILKDGKILVNKKIRKEFKFPVGIMDVLEIPGIKEHFRVLYTPKGMFTLHKISSEESHLKPAKIIGKRILKCKKVQINLSDGRNIIVEKDEFKVNDTLIFSMEDKWAIKKHLKFEKGALVYITKGKCKGLSGVIEDIKPVFSNPTITLKSKEKTFETSKHFAFIIDNSISLGESK